MFTTLASCANEYAMEKKEKKKNTIYSAKCHGALLNIRGVIY